MEASLLETIVFEPFLSRFHDHSNASADACFLQTARIATGAWRDAASPWSCSWINARNPKTGNQAYRMISTARLHMLPRFDLQPINVVVSDDP